MTNNDRPPFSAILWDMDGVLVDTFDGHYRAWKQTFEEIAHPFTLEDFRRTFGMNNRLIFRTLLGRELEEAEFQHLSDHKEELFRAGIRGTAQTLYTNTITICRVWTSC